MQNQNLNSKISVDKLGRDQASWRWKVLISTYFGYAGYYLTRKVFTICKISLAEEFNVGLDSIAHIWTAYLFAYMLGQFFNSFIGRKWGPRLLLLSGLGISIIINIIFGFANSYSTFMVFMFFNGLVQASGWPGSVGAIAHWLKKKERGTFMGFWSTNYLVGNIVVKMLGGYLLAVAGWRYAFWGCTLLAFAIWWLIFFWQRTKPQDIGLKPIISEKYEAATEVRASVEEHISIRDYFRLLLNPVVLLMGLSYFSIKFLRYALDSWLPTFLNLQGLDKAGAAYYSTIFDYAGLAGSIVAGIVLDKLFRGKWERLNLIMGLGMVVGYIAVIKYGHSPIALAMLFGFVGFMMYGPDTLLCGAASVQVAGEKNGVAVAGIVNGLGSIGPVVQEEVIGWLVGGRSQETAAGIRNSNYLALGMSVFFVLVMIYINWRLRASRRTQ
ncbi:MFS transporter [candidate division KSB1 bacterium]|nr:MFS transporter [candidate division KSB1 bacterium]